MEGIILLVSLLHDCFSCFLNLQTVPIAQSIKFINWIFNWEGYATHLSAEPYQIFILEQKLGSEFHYATFESFNPLTTNVPHYIETSQLVSIANQLTGFYMIGNIGR